MSRVDEAMRRAAELAARTELSAGIEVRLEEDTALPAEETDARVSDAFPIEMSERRRHARTSAAHPLRHPASESGSPPHRATGVSPSGGAPGPLLERIDRSLAEKVVIDQNMMSASREQYRRLAAALHHAQGENGLKVVMIASAAPGEGKTLTAANLGLTFSESYKRTVLLIDADLRRPALHKVFGTDNAGGLSEGLTAAIERRLPVRQVSGRLALLHAGPPSSDPMAGLTSDRMRRLIAEAREHFDWVLIDSPPIALLPDANLLAAMVDGTIVVVKAGSTSYDLVRRAVEAIGRPRILGVVLNRAETPPHEYGYKYCDTYYGGRPGGPSGP